MKLERVPARVLGRVPARVLGRVPAQKVVMNAMEQDARYVPVRHVLSNVTGHLEKVARPVQRVPAIHL